MLTTGWSAMIRIMSGIYMAIAVSMAQSADAVRVLLSLG